MTILHALEPHLMLIQDLENLLLDDPASSTLPPTSVPPALLEPSTTEESTAIIAGLTFSSKFSTQPSKSKHYVYYFYITFKAGLYF